MLFNLKRTKYSQLDSGIENIRCFILSSGLRKLVAAKDELRNILKSKYLKLKELSPPVQSSIPTQSLASLLSSVIKAQRRNKQTLQSKPVLKIHEKIFKSES